ncbi:MAG: hypothetical protein FWG98_09555 [Candidatus Cloacimonetes bacterium]|nr:hypothetical protein [Candidatus Cloacimonadota bacterium]
MLLDENNLNQNKKLTLGTGMMSDEDIRNAIRNKELFITTYNVNDKSDARLTPAGFNFSFSKFVVSRFSHYSR